MIINKVSEVWEASLMMIEHELDRIMWNIHQKEYASPFRNTGNMFEDLEEFRVEAYSWDEEAEQLYNFKWRNVEIRWHKHSRRGLLANIELTPDMAQEMLVECLAALRKYEAENDVF